MRVRARALLRFACWIVSTGTFFAALGVVYAPAQTNSDERVFRQSKATIEKALAALQANLAGRLPVLEGFAKPGEHPLDRYQRAYYQSTVQVRSTPSGGSVVHVSTKVTAWYADPVASHSGYQLLTSKGRLEADLLDQLADQLAGQGADRSAEHFADHPAEQVEMKKSTESSSKASSVVAPAPPKSASMPTTAARAAIEPAISAPAPKFPDTDRTFTAALSHGLAAEERSQPLNSSNAAAPAAPNAAKSDSALQAEADSLEEILKNQAHPKNLVAVKKSGTPVVSSPSLTAKTQFLASMHDEFEMLDFSADWVHVRISGLSRGWIWRNSVEMPEGIRNTDTPATSTLTPAADLFRVSREEIAPFPGDWEPLRTKSVKIISVQKINESDKDADPKARLEYAKFLLEKSYKEMAQKPTELAGIVVIFDSADGGMIAATTRTLQQWKAGALSDAALWHKCFFDPPETFESSGSSASQ